MAISQDIPQPSIIEISFTYVNFHLNLPGDNELKQQIRYIFHMLFGGCMSGSMYVHHRFNEMEDRDGNFHIFKWIQSTSIVTWRGIYNGTAYQHWQRTEIDRSNIERGTPYFTLTAIQRDICCGNFFYKIYCAIKKQWTMSLFGFRDGVLPAQYQP